jgi:hypothetical protein
MEDAFKNLLILLSYDVPPDMLSFTDIMRQKMRLIKLTYHNLELFYANRLF